MKILDVTPFQEGLARNQETLARLQEEMDAIRTAAQQLSDLGDSLTGEGGESIKAFYRECHLPLLETFADFKSTFETTMNSIKSAQETLEPAPDGYIMESFLEGEVETGLTTISTTTTNLTSDANGIMDSVADIVALPHLNDSEVQEGVRDARKKKDDTVTDLNEFDSTQTNSLTSIENDILRMELWVLDLEGAMQDGLSPVDFPAEDWAAFAEMHPLNTGQNHVPIETETVEDKEESGESGDVAGTTVNMASLSNAVQTASKVVEEVNKGEGFMSAFALIRAGRHGGISTSQHPLSKGGTGYRINATPNAMQRLNIPYSPKDVRDGQVMLKYATTKPGQSGWSSAGERAKQAHPSLEQFAGTKTTPGQKAKVVGTATLKGTTGAFKDLVDVKGIRDEFKRVPQGGKINAASGIIRGAGKALGPVGAAFSYNTNYQNAAASGLTGAEAHARAAKDTAIDTAVGGAVQAGFTAAGTALIPIPGVGTAVGMGLGILANAGLNMEIGDSGKSAMDHIKGWFS